MGTETKIGWAESTWSPWRGCVEVSPGCDHCYAAALAKRNPKVMGRWGGQAAGGVRVLNAHWEIPRKWSEQALEAGERRLVFPSLCDPFEDWGGVMHNHRDEVIEGLTMDQVRWQFFDLISETAGLVWLLLTKRPENVRMDQGHPAAWLIPTIENQIQHDRRAPIALAKKYYWAGVGYSIEPQLGPITLRAFCPRCGLLPNLASETWCPRCQSGKIQPDWVIIGGESGHAARPWFAEWGRDLIGQCRRAGIPVFMKQSGALTLTADLGIRSLKRARGFYHRGPRLDWVGCDQDQARAVRLLQTTPAGTDPADWPPGLNVREFPHFGEGGGGGL